MRKTFVVALIALVVMFAVTSCDNFPIPGGEKPEYTADGRKLVTLSVNIGGTVNGRSLNDTNAKADADYVEVVFKHGSDYFRTEGYFPTPIKIKIPADDYEIDEAIVLVGKKSDSTLLATGVLTATTPPSTGLTFQIDENTTSITFTVTSLVANITAGGGAGKAFEIHEDSGNVGGTGDKIEDTDFAGLTNNGLFQTGAENPWFQVPVNTTGINATLTISGFSATGNKIVRVSGGTPLTFSKVTVAAEEIPSSSVTSPAVNDAIGAQGKIDITFATPTAIASSPNRYQIIFAVPVVGFQSGITNQVTWNIRGGTTNGFDFTTAGTGKEDSIPLLVVEEAIDEYELDLTLNWS